MKLYFKCGKCEEITKISKHEERKCGVCGETRSVYRIKLLKVVKNKIIDIKNDIQFWYLSHRNPLATVLCKIDWLFYSISRDIYNFVNRKRLKEQNTPPTFEEQYYRHIIKQEIGNYRFYWELNRAWYGNSVGQYMKDKDGNPMLEEGNTTLEAVMKLKQRILE